ncbi:MAG TPA: DUF3180 family protein [Pseudolysinimonas sp.]|nr:hypothetical protein [Schumannella sp.]HEV7740868.1 DUF3180 family protein [Pseudolysinimonas sp.]
MTRTRPATLVVLAILGTGFGVLLQSLLAAMSMPKLRPEFTLAITLVLVGAAAVTLAVPVRRATRGNPANRVDPFYATSVVALAKAAALGGALLAGLGLGLVGELVLRSGAPGVDAYLRVFSVLGGGAALMIGGLVAEFFCTVPKSDDDDPDVGPPAPAG